jgi:hypothetical protein
MHCAFIADFTCGDNGRGEFILLYMLAYAFTAPITFLTSICMHKGARIIKAIFLGN